MKVLSVCSQYAEILETDTSPALVPGLTGATVALTVRGAFVIVNVTL